MKNIPCMTLAAFFCSASPSSIVAFASSDKLMTNASAKLLS